MYEHETPPAPPQNTPFPGLILKVGKMNYCLGKMDPIWAKCLKSGQNFSRSGQKKFIHKLKVIQRVSDSRCTARQGKEQVALKQAQELQRA